MIMKVFKRHGFIILFFYFQINCFAQIKQKDILDASAVAFDIYKQIHKYPELGKQEFKTSTLIKSKLQQFGFKEFYDLPNLPTAIIAILDSKRPGPVIGLRAELDARPGKENTNLPYASIIDTVMHSCGHDAHASILLAAAEVLMKNVKLLTGKIVFIFQPAEETKGGADDIVDAGMLKKLSIERIFAQHSVSGLPVGSISISSGYTMAGSNYFTVEITGNGSHAATPFEGNDIPIALSDLVKGIGVIPARQMAISERPCVISTTFMETGKTNALNVLPTSAQFKGTIRAYENIESPYKDQPSIKSIIQSYLETYCQPRNIKYTLKIEKGSPPTINNEDLFQTVVPKLQSVFSGKIDTSPYKGMFSEDFAYYTNQVPCLYFGLGVAKENLGYENVHTEKFSVHPDSFEYGIELMVLLAGLNMTKKI
jgi:amidohydrolase